MPWIEIGGRWVEVAVRESARARLLRVVAHADGTVEVVVPRGTSMRAVDRMLARSHDWVARQVARSHVRRLGMQRPDVVWLHGSTHPLPNVPSVERWYRDRAREAVTAVAEREANRLGVTYSAISIRDQRTRWGSCSARGALSFNWRLVLAPEPVLGYVVVHELCHLREHNHSAAFWSLVAGAWPTWERERDWLAEHGSELLAYRPPRPLAVAA